MVMNETEATKKALKGLFLVLILVTFLRTKP